MVTSAHRHRLAWFIPLRLATFVILFFAVVAWMGYPGFLRVPFFYYALVTLVFTLLLAFDKHRRLPTLTTAAVVLHFIAEIGVESGVIYATGNINSPFTGLFILTIVSAALVYRLVGTLLMASVVSLAYTFVIWLGLTTDDPALSLQALRTVFNTDSTAFYSIFLHILIFYLVAFMAGYLAERLRHQDRRLADASRALRQARLETDDILRHLNSGLITVDAEGRIVYFNRAAERILGYREEDVKGLRCSEVFAERMPNLAGLLTDGIRKKMAHIRQEVEIVDGNGMTVPVGLSISILTEEDYSIRGVIAIFSDLTEAKALEAKVRAADRLAAIGELSASIAHEIRNPLAAISGSVEVLKGDLDVRGENARLLELIVKESDRLTTTLNEFLQYARVDRPTYARVDLCHLVSDVVYLLRHHDSYADNIDLRFDSDQAVAYVLGDENLIKQLLFNLGVNACEATREKGGRVQFKILTRDPDVVTLRVEDTGNGMTAEQQRRIYEPFFSTKKQGTGLGLAIVHRICSVLKLTISLESREGHGTLFMVDFPLSTASEETARQTSGAASA
jgi:two-component system sensor histidine kinase PilS (NtrC family)